MSDEEKSFISQVLGSIASPKRAFDSVQSGDLWKGVALIIILAAVSALAGYTYASKMSITILGRLSQPTGFGPPGADIDPQTLKRNMMTFYALRDGLRAFTGWLLSAALIHILATVLAGSGNFKRMLALLGFAHIPLIPQQALRVIDAYTIPAEVLARVISNRLLGQSLGLRLLTNFLAEFTVFGVWSFALAFVAASANYQATYKKAAAAVMSAYILMILLQLFLPL